MLGHGILYVFVVAPLINGLGHWTGGQSFGNTGESLHNNRHAIRIMAALRPIAVVGAPVPTHVGR